MLNKVGSTELGYQRTGQLANLLGKADGPDPAMIKSKSKHSIGGGFHSRTGSAQPAGQRSSKPKTI